MSSSSESAAVLHLGDIGGDTSTDDDVEMYSIPEPSSAVTTASGVGLPAAGQRRIFLNRPDRNLESAFMGNRISTAKYHFWTFLPKFLYQEFSRYANLFFLFTAIIQQIPNVSPTGRFTTIVPLSIVLSITAVKELLEDWKRHRADDQVNNRLVKVFREGTFQTVRWTQVVVGDVVKVLNDQFFPADMILLSSSEPQAMCYVETANLDGETNLKIRQGLSYTSHITSTREVRALEGCVDCELPNNRLYKFVGNIGIRRGEAMQPLGPDQLLLRGAQLRNTPWVFGLVVYTGHESKLLLNTTSAPIKRSNVDVVTNRQIIFLFITLVALALLSAIFGRVWLNEHEHKDWYLGFSASSAPQNFFLTFLTFMILYNNLIPMSLIVTLELVKFVQALTFINNDLDMYDAREDVAAHARTSTLNEELGQVQYIFSDKTGTLTRNIMQFLKCSVAGISYGDIIQEGEAGDGSLAFSDPTLLDNLTSKHETASVIREWLTLLAVCHTVVPERDRSQADKIIYQAASPDEAALVKAVKQLGFSFNVRTPEGVTINALGQEEYYEVLNVLEFNSTRKRMSVIVRTPNGRIKLYCKGADSVIYERLSPRSPFKTATSEHLKNFASDGLRTLCLAVAQLSEDQYQEWNKKYYEASTALVDRAQKLDEVAEMIEQNLLLLGATAIEDKLQDGVPETIRSLATAGIKIWVLTGDKQETAINIGYSCKLLTNKMTLLIMNHESDGECEDFIMEMLQRHARTDADSLALVIDGHALTHALSSRLANVWLKLAKLCKAVICCRVSPLQKAQIVRLVKYSDKAITLAIGDGANDVGMIQAAHVGVGISGQEGLQAARAADYSIGQFRFLKKLLLVHGNWSYRRVTLLILYSFYKNIALYLIELFFAMENGFSGQILFEQWNIAIYNVVFTLLPPLAIGIFEQHISAQSLMSVPQLYKSGQQGKIFNTRTFWWWILDAIFSACVLFWLPTIALTPAVTHEHGKVTGLWYNGAVVYSVVVVTVTLRAALITTFWTRFTHIAIWGSLLVWFIFSFVYFELWKTQAFAGVAHEVYGIDRMMYSSGAYWFLAMCIPIFVLFKDIVYQVFQKTFFPSADDIIREREAAGVVLPEMARSDIGAEEEHAFEHTGFAFSQNENTEGVTQAQVIRAYDTNLEKPRGE
eukprot:m.190317 g.190317  ORF g.190317 m.190317 type:complete len:1160 (+) comp10581_c0_seq1:297-3776(+)